MFRTAQKVLTRCISRNLQSWVQSPGALERAMTSCLGRVRGAVGHRTFTGPNSTVIGQINGANSPAFYSGIILGLPFGNRVTTLGSRLKVSATISGGEWASQSAKDTSSYRSDRKTASTTKSVLPVFSM